jgi:hypothetical protein
MEWRADAIVWSAPAAHTDLTIVAFQVRASSSAVRRTPLQVRPRSFASRRFAPTQGFPPQVAASMSAPRRSVPSQGRRLQVRPAVSARRRSAVLQGRFQQLPRSAGRPPF